MAHENRWPTSNAKWVIASKRRNMKKKLHISADMHRQKINKKKKKECDVKIVEHAKIILFSFSSWTWHDDNKNNNMPSSFRFSLCFFTIIVIRIVFIHLRYFVCNFRHSAFLCHSQFVYVFVRHGIDNHVINTVDQFNTWKSITKFLSAF